MKILIAPDSFKGTLSANEVCGIIGQAFADTIKTAEITKLPAADGGEGLCACLKEIVGGETVKAEDLGASFIKAVTDILASHTISAAEELGVKRIVLAGGVSANSRLRRIMEEKCKSKGFELYKPELKFCGDNAAMIASQGFYEFVSSRDEADFFNLSLNAIASLPIN